MGCKGNGLQDFASTLQFDSMRFTDFLPLVLVFWTVSGLASPGPADLNRVGVEAFAKGDFQAAKAAFDGALNDEPTSPSLQYNLGLAELRLGNKGLAVGRWRKALSISPSYKPALHALSWIEPQLPRTHFGNDGDLWEDVRDFLLVPVSLIQFILLAFLLFFVTGWLALRYFGKRRRALLDESALPPFPVSATVTAVLFLLSLALVGLKAYDLSVARGTVVVAKVPVLTSPDPESASLFDLFEGFEIIVRQSHQDWLQVTQPGGLSGWIPKESVYLSVDNLSTDKMTAEHAPQ